MQMNSNDTWYIFIVANSPPTLYYGKNVGGSTLIAQETDIQLGLGFGHATMKYTHIYIKINNGGLGFDQILN